MNLGVPPQEQGVPPARALPYQLNVQAAVDGSKVTLTFINTGTATAVFQARQHTQFVRHYTVGPDKRLSDTFNASASYNLSVYGPNGFVRYFTGRTGSNAAVLAVDSQVSKTGSGTIRWKVTNIAAADAEGCLHWHLGHPGSRPRSGVCR